MNYLLKLLLLSQVVVSSEVSKVDDFSDIKLANDDKFDRSKEKKVTLKIERTKSHKDMVKDSLFNNQLNVKSPDI